MAERSIFWNALETSPGEYDRIYQAQDFATYFGDLLSDGLLHTEDDPGMSVEVEASTLNTVVSVGKALIKGHHYELSESPRVLTHPIPEPSHDRIDRVILRYDARTSGREILLHVLEGTPSSSPVPPELTRTEFIYELSLAQVRVRANTVQLLPSDLKDERLIDDLCGLVTWLPSLPTEQFQRQWDEFMDGVQDEGFTPLPTFNKHKNDDLVHISSTSIYRNDKDDEGTFVTVVRKRPDGTLLADAVMGDKNINDRYLTRTIRKYGADGITIVGTDVYDLYYDNDGDLISEVLRS